MSLWGDDRGAAIQVGAAILFAFVIIAITTYQVEVVPNQNAEIEFDHNQDVQEQLVGLNEELVGVANGGSGGTQSLTLGTRYPARTIFVNPGPASGQVRTTDAQTIRIENATADGEPDTVAAYWDGTEWNRSTRGITYTPNYNVYDAAPTTITEHGLLYNRHRNGVNRTITDQLLIDDDEVTVLTVRGNVSESTVATTSLRTEAFSTSSNTISVESTTSDPLTITLPTASPELWNGTLREETAVNNDSITLGSESITFELEPDTYSLQMAEVGVGDASQADPADRVAYLTPVDGDTSAPTVTVEVRDELNNPIKNVVVNNTGDGTLSAGSTGSNGQVRVTNLQPGDDVELEIDGETYLVVDGADGSNGGAAGQLSAPDDAIGFDAPGSGETAAFNLTVRNDGSDTVQLTDVRVIPEDPAINGLSDEASGTGPGTAELYVENDATGSSGAKNVLLTTDDEYAYVPRNGITLTLDERPPDEVYSTANAAFLETDEYQAFPFESEFRGTQVELADSETATMSLAEFHELTIGGATATERNVIGDRFSVTVGYLADGQRFTDQFVTTVRDPTAVDEADFQVAITDTNSPVTEGETLTVDADIDNVGGETATQTIELEVDGEGVVDTQSVTLGGGETTSETLEWQTQAGDAGSGIQVTVSSENDTDSTTVTVDSDTGGAPQLQSATVENSPLNQADAGSTHAVTLEFDEAMDTTVDPTVGLTNLGSSGSYNSSLDTNGGWVNDTVWESQFTLNDDDEDVESTLVVDDAEDQDGNVMNEDSSTTFLVDTQVPQDPDAVRITTDPINISNENAVDVEVNVRDPDSDGGDVFVRIADNDGNTVTDSTAMQTGSGTVTTTVSGIDVSSLNDADPNQNGGVTATARIVDDVGNENGAGFTTQSDEVLKDTVAPPIDRFEITNPSGNTLNVELETDESLSTIDVDIEDSNGNVVETLTRSDFSESESSGVYTYIATTSQSANDDYTAVLNTAEDQAGNDGAGGETNTTTLFRYSNQILEPVEVRDVGSPFVFRFENTAGGEVTIEQFEINASGVQPGITLDAGNGPELEIKRVSQNGVANRNGNPSEYLADGTRYDFVQDSNKGNDGQYAVLSSTDDSADADFRGLSTGIDVSLIETPSNADVVVRFVLSDGSEQVFYFEEN